MLIYKKSSADSELDINELPETIKYLKLKQLSKQSKVLSKEAMLKEAVSAAKIFNVFRQALKSGKHTPERLLKFEKAVEKWIPEAVNRAADAYYINRKAMRPSDISLLFNRNTLKNIRKAMIQLAPTDRYAGDKAIKVLPELDLNPKVMSSSTGELFSGRRVITLATKDGKLYPDDLLHELGHTMRHRPIIINKNDLKILIEELKASSLGGKLLKKLPDFYTEERYRNYLANMRKAFESYKRQYLLTRLRNLKKSQKFKINND